MTDPIQPPPPPPPPAPQQPPVAPQQPYGQPQYGQQQYAQQPYGQQQYSPPAGWQPGYGPWPYATHPDDAPTPGVGMREAVRLFFKKYAQFSGRASRSEYWWVALFTGLVTLVLYVPGIILASVGGVLMTETSSSGAGVAMLVIGIVLIGLVVLFALAILVPSIAIAVRRLHDANFSGLFYLLSLAGLSIVVLVMNVLESNPAGQRYDRPI